jgi:hypothetical protein
VLEVAISTPSEYPDKALVWDEYFNRRRSVEIRDLLTEEVIAEHKANPLGYRKFHSPALQRVLNYFRMQSILGKYVVYASEPWREYRIAAVTERGQPPTILDEQVFASEEEAMHGVFMQRCNELRASRD